MGKGRHRDLGQPLFLSPRRRRLPARGRPHPLARLDQRLRRPSRRSGGVTGMTITVSPFAAGLGADISGVDIREKLSTADRDAIRNAWLDNLVLRFRGQPMTDAQHMEFTRQFGELEFDPAKLIADKYGIETQTDGRKSEIPPEISVISNIIEDG